MARSNSIIKIREIAESSADPREALFAALGELDTELAVLHSQVLVATYVEPARTSGGILLPDSSLQEGRFQGSVGLVIALGPGAFKDDGVAQFHGEKVSVGDWVMFRPADGLEMFIRQVPCRLFEDVNIKMRVSNPQNFW